MIIYENFHAPLKRLIAELTGMLRWRFSHLEHINHRHFFVSRTLSPRTHLSFSLHQRLQHNSSASEVEQKLRTQSEKVYSSLRWLPKKSKSKNCLLFTNEKRLMMEISTQSPFTHEKCEWKWTKWNLKKERKSFHNQEFHFHRINAKKRRIFTLRLCSQICWVSKKSDYIAENFFTLFFFSSIFCWKLSCAEQCSTLSLSVTHGKCGEKLEFFSSSSINFMWIISKMSGMSDEFGISEDFRYASSCGFVVLWRESEDLRLWDGEKILIEFSRIFS